MQSLSTMAPTRMGTLGRDNLFLLFLRMLNVWPYSCKVRLFFAVTSCGFFFILFGLTYFYPFLDNAASAADVDHHRQAYSINYQDPPQGITRLKWLSAKSPAEFEHQKRIRSFSRILQAQIKRQLKGKNERKCLHPKLDLKHDNNQFAYHDMPPLNCTGSGFIFLHNGVLRLNASLFPDPEQISQCSYYKVQRLSDNAFAYSKPLTIKSPPFETKVDGDFVRVICILKSTLALLENDREKKDISEEEDADDDAINSDYTGPAIQVKKPDLKNRLDENDETELDRKESHENLTETTVYDNNDDYDESIDSEIENDENRLDYYQQLYDINPMRSDNPDVSDVDFDQFFIQIQTKKEVLDRISKVQTSEMFSHGFNQLNVLMFAMDSMSHLCFQRKMPKTYKYLKEILGAAVMENYNIVGDATTAALIPILTGKTEMELPEIRSSTFEANSVNKYPMIWNNYTDLGYVTLFAEDEPNIATFNLRFNGFDDPPTDHYMRPFWQALWDSVVRKNSQKYCTGGTAHHRFLINYLEDFFIKYRNVSRFAFAFSVELSHWDNNPAQYADVDLVAMLERLRQAGLLDDTVVIVLGDHGARYSKVRHTVQGKLEERLPMMSLAFPKRFQKLYPKLQANLMANTQHLSTPFDIHETLLDILNLTRTNEPVIKGARGISLLRNIPENRTCSEAGISLHWCTCMQQLIVDSEDEFVKAAAMEIMSFLNERTFSQRIMCSKLQLKQIFSAQIVLPNEQVLRYVKSQDRDQRVSNFSQTVDPDLVYYQLQIETYPCGGRFEASVIANFRNATRSSYNVTEEVSRINKYGSQPRCVQDKYPLLRKFCCCKDRVDRARRFKRG